jgi:RES domain-containing protein
MIEYFVHIESDDMPKDLVVVTADIPDSVSRAAISWKQLPANWRQTPAPSQLLAIGDEFVRDRRAAVFIVPSALASVEFNWLVNPQHHDFPKIRVNPAQPFEYDLRFLKSSNPSI